MLIKLNQKISIFNLTSSQFAILKNMSKGASIEDSFEELAEEISLLFSLLRSELIPLRKICSGA